MMILEVPMNRLYISQLVSQVDLKVSNYLFLNDIEIICLSYLDNNSAQVYEDLLKEIDRRESRRGS